MNVRTEDIADVAEDRRIEIEKLAIVELGTQVEI